MEGKEPLPSIQLEFPKGIAFMLDLGIFGRSFKSLDKNHVGLRIENHLLSIMKVIPNA